MARIQNVGPDKKIIHPLAMNYPDTLATSSQLAMNYTDILMKK